MRTFKFRAWDKNTELMIYGKGFLWEREAVNFIFMEFTGLKDKNKIEVYEGDILMLNPVLGLHNCIVKYDEERAKFTAGKHIDDLCWNIKHDQGVVIGNIYENPGLLENI